MFFIYYCVLMVLVLELYLFIVELFYLKLIEKVKGMQGLNIVLKFIIFFVQLDRFEIGESDGVEYVLLVII